MLKRSVFVALASLFSFFVLSVSILKASEIHYIYSKPANFEIDKTGAERLRYDMSFALYPGSIAPNNPLWNVKVGRDKLWLLVTTDPTKKSELNLLMGEKRLSSASALFLNNQTDLGISVLTKSEKYLENAFNPEASPDLLFKIANSAIFHRQIIEDILTIAPEQARPMIVSTLDYSKRIYKESARLLTEKGKVPPKNPLDE